MTELWAFFLTLTCASVIAALVGISLGLGLRTDYGNHRRLSGTFAIAAAATAAGFIIFAGLLHI